MKLENKNWVGAQKDCEAPYFRKTFTLKAWRSAKIAICGLGFYQLYVNGYRVGKNEFVPVTSDYRKRDTSKFLYPVLGEFTYRTYYDVYDIGEYLRAGKNVIAVALGNGWYNQHQRQIEAYAPFGTPRLTFRLDIAGEESLSVVSDANMCWHSSEVLFNNLFYGEKHDMRLCLSGWTQPDYEDTGWKSVCTVAPFETVLTMSPCPGDRAVRTLIPKKIKDTGTYAIYDAGENISGWVKVQGVIQEGASLQIRHAETLSPDFTLDFTSCGGTAQIQETEYIGNGNAVSVHPKFSWQAFRYFEVTGAVENGDEMPFACVVVHGDIAPTSEFTCSNETLNWLYQAYINTQLANIHAGVPLDCPSRERLGYTGDGQLCCGAAMLLLDAQRLYQKWIQDVLDCQDKEGGRVQHTAPFQGGGGGPAGWGAAIVETPYQYHLHYQDEEMLRLCYEPMCKWFSYLDSRSEDDLVVAGEPGGWCLGEWNTPGEVKIPAPFVNTYFFVKSLRTAAEIAKILGKPEEGEVLLKRARQKAVAIKRHFFSEEENTYCGGVQGADAFAADIGLANEEMLQALNRKYQSMDAFDTGIFGTDVVIRVLFENGFAQTAFNLLTATGPATYETMRREGATTIYEAWLDRRESKNHPMFGAVVKYLFIHLLGIKQSGAGRLTIAPQLVEGLDFARGKVTLSCGVIEVGYQKTGREIAVSIVCPENADIRFCLHGREMVLQAGINAFTVPQHAKLHPHMPPQGGAWG